MAIAPVNVLDGVMNRLPNMDLRHGVIFIKDTYCAVLSKVPAFRPMATYLSSHN